MILLVNIVFILFSYLPDDGYSNFNYKNYNPDFNKIEIIFSSLDENIQENYFSSFYYENRKEIGNNICGYSSSDKIFNQNKYSSILNRLLSSLIDIPPPSFEFYIS